MIKRWIARRRRRLDLYGRMRGAEDRLREVTGLLGEMIQRTERLGGLEHDLAEMERRLAQAEARFEPLEREIGEVAEASHRESTSLQERLSDLDARISDVAREVERAVGGLPAAETAVAAANGLSIRVARLETQRQLDIEEGRRTALASLSELKRTIIRWRSADEALTQIDRTFPTRDYVGRSSENRRPPRVYAGLTAGVPFLEASSSDRLHMVALAQDGAPTEQAAVPVIDDDVWVAIAPAGSLASPDFSSIVLDHIDRHPEVAVFYADDIAVQTEEAIDQIRLKPEFDLTLLSAQDYVGAPLIVRGDALKALGGLDRARGTAACADLLFRAHARGLIIRRIAEVLLAHPGRRVRASAVDYRSMLQAQASLDAYQIRPGATLDSFRLERRFTGSQEPPVAVLVPTRRTTLPGSDVTYVERLLSSLAATDWPMDRLTVVVGDDVVGTPEWALRRWPFRLQRVETPRAPDTDFNYAAKMNVLWRTAEAEQIVFMNDDVQALDGDWLKALQTFALDPGVGGVGARLLFEDGSLQHAGMAPHGPGTAHLWVQRLGSAGVYQNWSQVHREWSMVTGAIFATRRSLMERMGGFDERFSLEFNDTDLALRLREAGYRIVATPFAQMVHAERASRKDTPPPGEEAELFFEQWSDWLANDPSWHPNLDRNRIEMMPAPEPGAWYL